MFIGRLRLLLCSIFEAVIWQVQYTIRCFHHLEGRMNSRVPKEMRREGTKQQDHVEDHNMH